MDLLIDLQTWLHQSMARQLSAATSSGELVALAVAMSSAVFFGFVHAFTPGHGKSVLVSYFLGQGGTIWRGFAVAALLALTHVVSAIVLVLAGFNLLQRTIGGSGTAPSLELTSGILVTMVGAWLLWRALGARSVHRTANDRTGGLLAIGTGLVDCPLTTFIMVYAVSRGIVLAGLAVSLAMAAGLIVTLALFAVGAVLARESLLHLFERLGAWPRRIGRGLEIASAVAIIGFGLYLVL